MTAKKKSKFLGFGVKEIGLIFVGSSLMALAITWFSASIDMVVGGAAGLAIIIRHFSRLALPFEIPVFVSFVILNIPLFIIGAVQRGFGFVKKTGLAVIVVTGVQAVLEQFAVPFDLRDDLLINALIFGVLSGAGVGLVFGVQATTGGSDMLAAIIKHKFPRTSTAKTLLIIDAVIILAGMIVFGFRLSIYAIIAAFVASRVITYILEGLRFSKAAFVISAKHEEIAALISQKMGRGSTAWASLGMYTGNKVDMLFVVIGSKEAADLRSIVYETDPSAFVAIADVREVLGEGFVEYDSGQL